jgi:hypothetical protein
VPDKQEEMVAQMKIKQVQYIVLGDVKLDGREDLRFIHTHEIMYKEIQEHYRPIEFKGFPENYQVFQRNP